LNAAVAKIDADGSAGCCIESGILNGLFLLPPSDPGGIKDIHHYRETACHDTSRWQVVPSLMNVVAASA
jgi:hypothetical protein